jgi:hypothetical protein
VVAGVEETHAAWAEAGATAAMAASAERMSRRRGTVTFLGANSEPDTIPVLIADL